MSSSSVPQAFSVDVEEYFHVNAFEDVVSREDWPTLPSRVSRSIEELLELLDRYDATATFFVLGWVADRHPEIPRRIADAGHEIASHGWWHRRVVTLTRDEFALDVRASREKLEDLTGRAVLGFRAPSFSILPSVDWAYDVLIEQGFAYDSSVFPIRRRDYGNPHADPRAHVVERAGGRIVELPLATRTIAGFRVPGAGGAYLRHLPFALTRGTFREYANRGESGVLYVHPWELDPGQPRLEVSPLTRWRHYGHLDRTKRRIERLLSEFRFASLQECFDGILNGTASGGAPARPRLGVTGT